MTDLLGAMKHGHACPIANERYAWAVAEITGLRQKVSQLIDEASYADLRASGGINGDAKVSGEQIARTLALSYGRDPDAMTEWTEMCDAHNRPVPIWRVYEEQAEALLASYSVTSNNRGTE